MKHRIGESHADVAVLLETLTGTERPAASRAVWSVIAALAVGIITPAIIVVLLIREPTYDLGWWFLAALAVFAPYCGSEMLVRSLSTLECNADG